MGAMNRLLHCLPPTPAPYRGIDLPIGLEDGTCVYNNTNNNKSHGFAYA